jgi:hypothetical protein
VADMVIDTYYLCKCGPPHDGMVCFRFSPDLPWTGLPCLGLTWFAQIASIAALSPAIRWFLFHRSPFLAL